MRLCQIASIQSWLPGHSTAADPIWQRDILAVSDGEIQLFYARASLSGTRQAAIDAIDMLQAAVISAAFRGELKHPPAAIIMHEPPPEPFFMDELVDGMNKLTHVRAQACLFALESSRSLDEVANLTWKKVHDLKQLRPTCAQVLSEASQTRHLRLPYVFWEWATVKIATPLLELAWSVDQAFGKTWPQLVRSYRSMVLVDRHKDWVSLQELISSNKK